MTSQARATPPPIRLLVVGRQGSGKGTQSQRLARHLGVPHISSGDLFRAAIAEGSSLGRHLDRVLKAGQLVSDDLTLQIVAARLAQPDAVRGWILDGFPRTLDQAVALDRLIAPATIDAVINIDVPLDVVAARISERGRDDDTPDALTRRLATYEAETVPVIGHYRELGRVVDVNGVGTVEEVFARIAMRLAEYSVTARPALVS